MIHDEGIEKAIDWLHVRLKTKDDRQVIQAIISGLRELQTARQTIADKKILFSELKERADELSTELFGYVGAEGKFGKAALMNYFTFLEKQEVKE